VEDNGGRRRAAGIEEYENFLGCIDA
jgi:hypothetical protein